MTPRSGFLDGTPRLHYLEWNSAGRDTLVLLHGNSANAWWWQPFADAFDDRRFRLLAIDLRGHGDSAWIRPAAYTPADYADDLARTITATKIQRPIVVGHSMGGIAVIAFAAQFPLLARAAVAIDVAVTSTPQRNRYLSRLRSLPAIAYPDLTTATARFRLMPNEGDIPPATLAAIAEHSLVRTSDGRYTMKFDRESFFGSDGLDVAAVIQRIALPLLLVRAEHSRIMSVDAAERAAASNPRVCLTTIPSVHHHLLLERPDLLAQVISDFATSI
jgi:pimeloyl-ACP methyl ester carboxylesterase